MELICAENEIFYSLVEKVVERLKEREEERQDNIWLSTEEAMGKLKITSKTTLQKLRDEGNLRYTQPTKKLVLYDRNSIDEFLDSKAKNKF